MESSNSRYVSTCSDEDLAASAGLKSIEKAKIGGWGSYSVLVRPTQWLLWKLREQDQRNVAWVHDSCVLLVVTLLCRIPRGMVRVADNSPARSAALAKSLGENADGQLP
ncbi:hypothetical protein CRG98_042363 [Punica granatum]|uniref:Uncharacterized protein n=1 Tax=Punica granatum TaxID=22663 RepID=A0A2I0HZV3_PUNGR|nr:hypothetical protein CRG98_042363 [Punica granatum]